jgi:signal transduction histidine kinase
MATQPPPGEHARLQALYDYAILDTDPEQSFDDVTALAARLLKVPMALISLVDAERTWFKSRIGLADPQAPRDITFCAHAVAADALLEVPDATRDPRFAENPLVTGELSLRFYAGMPIHADDGSALGTLCVLDHQPRQLTEQEHADLQRLARVVEELLALRKVGLTASARQRHLEMQQSITDRLLESLAEAVVACNAEGQLTLFNETARHWHGIEAEGTRAEHWTDRYGLFAIDAVTPLPLDRVPLYRALHGEIIREVHMCIATAGQTPRFVACNGGPLTGADGQSLGAVIVMHDISERRRVDLLKRSFLAAVSHELRTPLTSISGSIDLLLGQAGGQLPTPAQAILRIAHTNARRLNALVNDLLDIEKLESGHMRLHVQPEALLPLLQSALDANAGYAASFSITLELDPASVGARVLVDASRLMQVLDNYLSNAAKFSQPGGRVVLRSLQRDSEVEVQVQDQGIGIDPMHHSELFQMFSQVDGATNRRRGGTGLGLALARQFIERMGGSVGVESQLGSGSIFWFRLPLLAADEAEP